MKAKSLLGIVLAMSVTILFGCAGMTAREQPMQFSSQKFETGKYDSRADNVEFILDASATMGRNDHHFESAKNFIAAVNQSLPSDLNTNVGLRTFGHDDRQSKKETELVYGLAPYSESGLQGALQSVKYAGGNSPLPAALKAAEGDLRPGSRNSVVVVSDGLVVSNGLMNPTAPEAAADLVGTTGPNTCIYTVWIGNDPKGKETLQKVAKAGSCGDAYDIAELSSGAGLGNFVQQVFLTGKPAPPPPAPKPAPAPAPKPAPVIKKEVVTFNLLFGFDKSNITDEMIPILEQAKSILDEDQAVRFTVAGHTDSIGTEAYNQDLSERRALSVKDWLVKHGVDQNRLDIVGYGELRPKYDNSTEEGRRLNRRVELESN